MGTLHRLITVIAVGLFILPFADALAQSKAQVNQAANIINSIPKPLASQFTKGQLRNHILFGKPQDVQRYCNQNIVNRNECLGTANILKQFKR